MLKLKRIQLFGKLDSSAYKALESATVLCKTRGNPYVELVHLINQILMADQCDLHEILRYFNIDEARVSKDMVKALDMLPRGASSISDFAPSIEKVVKDGWMAASLVYKSSLIRTGYLLLAIKQDPELNRLINDISPEFLKINGDLLQDKFEEITASSKESAGGVSVNANDAATGQAGQMLSSPAMGKGEALALYTIDLTQEAKEGKIDNIVGRDAEIRKMVNILMRRRQNNPILTGEAGVGKTAVVEGFAKRLADGDVPDCLKGTSLKSLDLGLLQAGASMKGEFENRLKQVIEEVQHSDTPIILFIDEAHRLIGAGGSAGQNDAANLLKPALARGQLRCIAATTVQEYAKYFEKDPALTRRFENILVEEPDDDKAVQMLRGMVGMLEKHHGVRVLDEALVATVKLSRRYIPARQLPDKGVSILDTACAKVALSQSAEPAALEFSRRKLEALNLERDILQREDAEGYKHAEELENISRKIDEEQSNYETLKTRLESIKNQAKNYFDLRNRGRQEVEDQGKTDIELDKKLQQARNDLNSLQGESPMLLPEVDSQAVSSVISDWTGIPLGRMVKDEIKSVLHLSEYLQQRVIGQAHAMDLIAKRLMTARAALADPKRPIAVLMLAGPSGVGKTETALALAEQLYGTENNLITINMSEFQEAHTVSTLKGAPPGYVGYGEGGVLTEAVRRRPYSVVLLDEIEKAHKDVHEVFFQVFDKGQMEDGSGRLINFRNCVIILTTNAGDEEIVNLCKDENNLPDMNTLEEAARPALRRVFPAALLGRLSVIPYYPLGKDALNHIVDLKLRKIVKRVKENYRATLSYTQNLRDEIISRCNNAASGARLIDAVVNNDLLPEISAAFLEQIMEGKELKAVSVDAKNGKFVYSFECKEF